MSVAEAEVRMTALRSRERSNDLRHWMDSFLSQLSQAPSDGTLAIKVGKSEVITITTAFIMPQEDAEMDKIKVEDIGDMLGKYMQQTGWTKLCLLLDYDGYG